MSNRDLVLALQADVRRSEERARLEREALAIHPRERRIPRWRRNGSPGSRWLTAAWRRTLGGEATSGEVRRLGLPPSLPALAGDDSASGEGGCCCGLATALPENEHRQARAS